MNLPLFLLYFLQSQKYLSFLKKFRYILPFRAFIYKGTL